ncbi:unnamed protein product [Sphagnum jensenii]
MNVLLQHVAPYQAGNAGRLNSILAGKFGTNGHQPQAVQQVSTPSNKSDKVTTDQTDVVEMTLKNVKLNPPLKSEEIEPLQPRPSTPVSSRGVSTTITTTTVSTPTPTQARKSSLGTTKLHTASNIFRAANRSDLMVGLSPRATMESASARHLTDESRPATTAGEKPASKPEEHNTVESLRGDVGADAPRIDSPSHRKRGVPAKRSFDSADRSVQSASFPQLEKLSTETHVANEGENSGAIWNGSRSYRHSSSFEIPADNVRGRFQSFTDDMTRAQSARHTTGIEASTTGRADSGRTKALLAQWERKDRPSFSEATHVPNSCLEMPRVSSSFSEVPPALDIYSEVPSVSINGGVKTLGLDINSFVPKGSGTTSDQTVSAMKHDTDIIDELMRQHHTMASIMQSRLTNMQVLVDVLSVLMERTELLTLEICCMLVPLLNGLLTSDNDRNLITALSLLLKLVTTFGPVINTTRASAPPLGVDLQAEQRLERCVMCYHELQTVGHCLLPLMRRGGEIASLAKELRSALERV